MTETNTQPVTVIKLVEGLSADDLADIARMRKPKGATHIRVLPTGKKRAIVDKIKELEHYAGVGGSLEFGTKGPNPKDKFEPMPIRHRASDKARNTRPKREDTGLNKLMYELLLTGVTREKGDLYPRSRYTVQEALEKVREAFPDKDPASLKKMLRVRPRSLERMKTGIAAQFDDAGQRAPRWALARNAATQAVEEST